MHDIPGYTLLRPLGRGGMATVYLALQQSLGREVALKVLAPSAGASEVDAQVASERFLREARIAASLHHPHIVPIHDFGVHAGLAYLAMEYEPGGTIAPMAGEKLAPRDALRVVRDIAGALDYAHGRGVVHRDIKPENILRRGDGAAVLSDFGIARLIQGESLLTIEGTSVGTPHYMSPEQLRGDKLDGRSDLYALGVVLWQLLTGELPYTGSDHWAIGTQHLGADIPRLPAALAYLQPLLDGLLAKKPEARLQSGAEIAQRVDALLATAITPDTAPAVVVLDAPRRRAADAAHAGDATRAADADGAVPRVAPRRRAPRALLLAGVLAVPVLAWFGWRHPGTAPVPAAPPPAAAAGVTAPVATSIAVLPLEDLSPAHDQGYFSDGMAEELQSRLAQVPGLQVAGRTSSQSFKGKEATIAQVGKALDVGNVLEGSVRKDGQRLRVTMRLSNVATGFQTWTQTYDRKLTDVFAVQDDIAGAVVETLKLRLMAGGGEVARHHTPGFAVYDYYLRARQAMKRTDGSTFVLARDLFAKAAELDPQYADAWSGLAMAESFVGEDADDPAIRAAADKRARAAADRAVALDPQLGDAYATRGYLRTRAWDWNGALADVEKSVVLDPSDARNHLRKGYLLATLGRLPEARAALEQAVRADPLFTPAWLFIARVTAAQGDDQTAKGALARVGQIEPGSKGAAVFGGVIALVEGDAAAARAGLSQSTRRYSRLLADYAVAAPDARPALRRQMAEGAAEDRFGAAEALAWAGDADAAFLQLDAVVAAHDDAALAIPYDPLLRSLHADPRYAALLARMGLAPR